MKFGLVVIGHHSDKEHPSKNFKRIIEQVQTAEEVGFDSIWAGQHYVVEDNQKFQVVPAVSRLVAETENMHFGIHLLLPLHHPVDIAEQFATLDAITGGRVILSPVAGYREKEFNAFGIHMDQRWGRLNESVEIIKKLWTEDAVTYDGEYFSIDNVSINPKPVSDPRPPIWIGANGDRSVRRANSLGDAWIAYPIDSIGTISSQLKMINQSNENGLLGRQPMTIDAFVAESDEKAREIYGPVVRNFFEWYDDEGLHEIVNEDDDSMGENRFIVGSPETVVQKVRYLRDQLGIDYLNFGVHKPELSQKDTLECIRLIGNRVIPNV